MSSQHLRHLRHFLLAALALPLAAAAAPRYTVTALPAATSVSAINELGQVAGAVATPEGLRGYVWSRAGLTPIPAPAGSAAFATGINHAGTVAGYTSLGAGDERRSFVFAAGGAAALDVFGAAFSYARAINDSGQVAGAYARGGDLRAYLYQDGAAIDLGTLGGAFAAANGINNRGQVVGFSSVDDSEAFNAHAFLYQDGVMLDLGTLAGGSLSEATAINELGQITGSAWVRGSNHAFLFSGGELRDLGTLGGRFSFGYDINNRGVVVGAANRPDDLGLFAFVHDGRRMIDLNTLIDPAAGWVLSEARAINDRGQIAAFGCQGEVCRGVLLEPAQVAVAEPPPWLLMFGGLGLMGWRRVSAAYRYGRYRPRRKARRT